MRSLEMEMEWRGQQYEVTCTEVPAYDPLQMFSHERTVTTDPLAPLTYSFSLPIHAVNKGHMLACLSSNIPALFSCTFIGGDVKYTKTTVNCSFTFVPLNSELTPDQQQSLQAILDKYKPAFSSGQDDIGSIQSPHHVKHTIRVKEGANPVCTSRPMTSFSV